ncbi:mycofactocin-coupled SDR family oxidoreductase [Geodermatophilus sp. CPCC 205506]|uniref:mycofactocin-coupled SDR family oxidoreductase n=1 Tax=Geodermatophilus sp. CPCC 205506 TaxID=2936596 RepID=UPI003EE861CE
MSGKVVLITGGARGQGRSHAVRMAEEGADIIVTDVCEQLPFVDYDMSTREDLAETVALVEKSGRTCLSYEADARDVSRMREVVNEAVAQLGRLDTVIINHGISTRHDVHSEDADEIWDLIIDTNLSAVFKTVRATVPHMLENGGSIIVTASAAGLVPLFGNTAYAAAKHGVIGLVRTLAAELGPKWIRVNAVCPTAVATPLFLNDAHIKAFCGTDPDKTIEDMKWPAQTLNLLPVPWIEADAVSEAMLYLASDAAKYVTGVALPVDAGMTAQPPGITPFIGQRLWELSQ